MPATLAASFSAWRYEAKWPEAGAQARAAAQGVRQVGPKVSDTETAFPLNQSRGMRAAASNLLRRVPTRCCPRCGDPAARPPGRLPPASPRHAALGQVCAVGVCVARTCKCCLVCASCRVVWTRLRARRGGGQEHQRCRPCPWRCPRSKQAAAGTVLPGKARGPRHLARAHTEEHRTRPRAGTCPHALSGAAQARRACNGWGGARTYAVVLQAGVGVTSTCTK
jgi:hypothetical protein